MRKLILILCISVSHFVFPQQKFLEISNDLKEGKSKMSHAFSVFDEETGNLAIFMSDQNKMYGFLYSKTLNLIGKIATDGLPNKYGQVIGYSIHEEKIRLFMKDGGDKTFGSVLFDFPNENAEETLYDFKLKHEIYVEGYNDTSKFYLMTMLKGTNKFFFYVFEEGKDYTKETLDLSGERFQDNVGAVKNLNTIMATGGRVQNNGSNYQFQVDKIDAESPNSIEATSEIVKMYSGKSGFKLTVDTQRRTYIIDISTPNLNYSVTTVNKPFLTAPDVNSNSFILQDKIYLLSASDDEMVFTVKSIETDQELKNYHIKKDDDIPFKNSPIIQEGGIHNKYRVMDKTSKFLRRIAREDIGISVTKANKDLIVIMGSKKDIVQGGAPMMPGFGFPMGTIGGFTATFNPTFFAYGSYTRTKATRIECLFDENLNHKKGTVPKNIFDTINQAAVMFPNKDAETIFKLNPFYIWGFYNAPLNQYVLYKF